MPIVIEHKYTSPKADVADSSLIRPSNWNDNHNITMAGQRLLGRGSAGNGNAEELAIGDGLQLVGTTLSSTAPDETISTVDPTGGSNGDKWFKI